MASARPPAAAPGGPAAEPRRRRSASPLRGRVADAMAIALLAILGLGSGVSAIADGFYDLTVWGPITVAMLALALAGAAVAPGRPRVVPALAVGTLVALWAWSRLSVSWAESADQALVTTGRWALYAAMCAALLLLMRSRRDRWLPLAFATAGVMVVASYVLLRMLEGDVESLFFGGRLRDPLGYANGQAGYFLLGFWPCVALAEQTRSRALAGLGAACAVVLGSLLVLSQTRGVLPAILVSGLAVVLVVPGRPRRVWALAAIGLGLAAISGPLLDVYSELPEGRAADPQPAKDAARVVLLAAALVGLGWAAVQAVLARLGRDARIGDVARRGEAVTAAGAVVLALAAAVAVVGDPVDKVREQYDDFVTLRTDSRGDTRFLSGGGYRYDYWRVAWLEVEREPLRGLGAGNYDRLYFTERRTSEDIRQPHSLPLQTMAELGLVGGLLLFAFVGAVLAGFWRQCRRGRQSLSRRTLAVAAGGAFVAWLAHTGVDWLHNIPGVTGIAICAAAALVAPWTRRAHGGWCTSSRIVAVTLVAVLAVAAADSAGRLAIADKDRIEARDALRSDPVEALRLSNESLTLNDESVPALYVKSAAYARLGRYRPARSVLEEAIALEPHDHLTWALLGDLEARRGKFRAARRNYRRALELNPRNRFVRDLVRDPRNAVGAGG